MLRMILLLSTILVSSQQDFDNLTNRIHRTLSSRPAELKVVFEPGTYRFRDDHVNLYGEKYPETRLVFEGNGAVLVGTAPEYSFTNFYPLDRIVEVVDESAKLCRIKTRKRLPGPGKLLIQVTSWYRLFTGSVKEIKGGYIFFTVDDLQRSGLSYNINGDRSYGKKSPRFRLVREVAATDPVSTAAFKFTDCAFKSVVISGFTFERNTGGRSEYAKDCLIRFYKNDLDEAEVQGCTFRSLGSDVIHIAYTDGVAVRDCRFEDCFRIGVLSYNHSGKTVIRNNVFERMDLGAEGYACVVCAGSDYEICENRFIDYGNCAIRAGLHYSEEMKFPSSGLIEKNEIFQTAPYRKRAPLDLLMDTGAIYVCTQNKSLVIRNNSIHDISGPYDNRGIFCDDGTVNTVIENNEIVRIGNSYCIDLRMAKSVETRSDSKIRKVNVGNRMSNNRTDGKIRFENRD